MQVAKYDAKRERVRQQVAFRERRLLKLVGRLREAQRQQGERGQIEDKLMTKIRQTRIATLQAKGNIRDDLRVVEAELEDTIWREGQHRLENSRRSMKQMAKKACGRI